MVRAGTVLPTVLTTLNTQDMSTQSLHICFCLSVRRCQQQCFRMCTVAVIVMQGFGNTSNTLKTNDRLNALSAHTCRVSLQERLIADRLEALHRCRALPEYSRERICFLNIVSVHNLTSEILPVRTSCSPGHACC
jgi:hypothetical protein